jgi:hypothetical protein
VRSDGTCCGFSLALRQTLFAPGIARAKAHDSSRGSSRSAEALLPPHECGGFHHESAGFQFSRRHSSPVVLSTFYGPTSRALIQNRVFRWLFSRAAMRHSHCAHINRYYEGASSFNAQDLSAQGLYGVDGGRTARRNDPFSGTDGLTPKCVAVRSRPLQELITSNPSRVIARLVVDGSVPEKSPAWGASSAQQYLPKLFTRHNSPACCLGSGFEFLQMRLCQIRLFQPQIDTCQ